jgi:hypothetical protein
MISLPRGKVQQTAAYVRDMARRVEGYAEPKRPSDAELRHLRLLRRAYGGPSGPEVLVIGDSIMFRAAREPDRRRAFDMIADELVADVRCLAIPGDCYNARMAMAFLTALTACRSRPKVVVAPLSPVSLMKVSLDHPERGQARAAAAVRAAVDAWPELPKTYEKPTVEDWDFADRLPVASRVGLRRTLGELDLFINATPSSPGQQTQRLRHLVDSYTAERLEPQSAGIRLVTELGGLLQSMNLRSVAAIPPVRYEQADELLGDGTRQHIAHNAKVIETAFLESAGYMGRVVNLALASGDAEFSDPLHLNQQGRHRLARQVAESVDAQLSRVDRPRHAAVALAESAQSSAW